MNYYQGRWNLDRWNDYARYSVYDDIPWDDFGKLGFPPKQSLLTQQENPVFVSLFTRIRIMKSTISVSLYH